MLRLVNIGEETSEDPNAVEDLTLGGKIGVGE